jgi:hypothetical protein
LTRHGIFVVCAVSAGLALAGCAAKQSPPITIAQARAGLIGLHASQVQACLGPPPIQRRRGDVTLWSYPSPTAGANGPPVFSDPSGSAFNYTPYSSDPAESGMAFGPGLGVSEGPVPPSGCIVNVVLDNDTARAVTFAGPHGRLLHEDSECTQVLRPCFP